MDFRANRWAKGQRFETPEEKVRQAGPPCRYRETRTTAGRVKRGKANHVYNPKKEVQR